MLMSNTLIHETQCCVGVCLDVYSAAMTPSAPQSAATVVTQLFILCKKFLSSMLAWLITARSTLRVKHT